MASPILYPEYLQMISDRNTKILSGNGNFQFVDAIVPLKAFIEYYHNPNRTGNGLRFYPGLTQQNRLVMICCNADEQYGVETDFRIFEQTLYPANHTFPRESGPLEYGPFQHRFREYIIADGLTGINPLFKYARYFAYVDLDEFINQNIPGALAQPDLAEGYFIKMNHGLVNENLATIALFDRGLENEMDIHTAAGLMGYTAIMYLIDREGADMINPIAGYSRHDYLQLFIEMACPCPAKCP